MRDKTTGPLYLCNWKQFSHKNSLTVTQHPWQDQEIYWLKLCFNFSEKDILSGCIYNEIESLAIPEKESSKSNIITQIAIMVQKRHTVNWHSSTELARSSDPTRSLALALNLVTAIYLGPSLLSSCALTFASVNRGRSLTDYLMKSCTGPHSPPQSSVRSCVTSKRSCVMLPLTSNKKWVLLPPAPAWRRVTS